MSANNIDRRAEKFVESEGKDYVAVTDLQPGAVGIVGAIMQNVTHIAPAIAAFFFTQTLVTNAGGQAPLAYLIGLIIVIPLGVCLMELARKFPSAGGYFTYVSRTLGPSLGFLTAWVFVLYSPVVAGPSLAVLGQSLVLIYSIYAAFVPLPAAPNNWTPVVAAAWLALGVIILVGMRATGNEAWLTHAAAIVAEREERPGEKHPSL